MCTRLLLCYFGIALLPVQGDSACAVFYFHCTGQAEESQVHLGNVVFSREAVGHVVGSAGPHILLSDK